MYRFFESLVDPFDPQNSGRPPARLWPYLMEELRPFRPLIPWLCLGGIAVAGLEAGLISYGGRVIDLLNANAPHELWLRYGLELVGVLVVILLLRPLAFWITAVLQHQALSGALRHQVQWRAHKHLLGQSRGFFQNEFAGRLANRVMQLGPAVDDNVFTFFEAVWFVSIYFLGALLVMSGITPVLVVPMLLWLAIFVWYALWMGRRIAHASEEMSRTRSMVTARIVDAYANIDTVKLFAGDDRERDFALEAMRADRERFLTFLRLWARIRLDLGLLTGVLIVGTVGLAVVFWARGGVSVGEISVVTALALRLSAMTGWIMWVSTMMFENAGRIKESLESVSVPHSVTDAPDAPPLEVRRGAIAFKGISHHYGKAEGGLDRIDLEIAPGEKIGLVGRSGAGKTTLVNLLLRFMDPERGHIEIDGQDISKVTQESLRAAIGMVTQDPSLMHRSVRDNILLGRPDASDEELHRAIARADAADFIPTLRDSAGRTGLDAHVGERGVKLSGGQRQRIALARVILKDAPILVLDEATSALDSDSEATIQTSLYSVMEGKTVIAIAHRLSTIARMDRIVVLDEGRIVEEGTHASLLARGGVYARLWEHQTGGLIAAK